KGMRAAGCRREGVSLHLGGLLATMGCGTLGSVDTPSIVPPIVSRTSFKVVSNRHRRHISFPGLSQHRTAELALSPPEENGLGCAAQAILFLKDHSSQAC